MYKCNNCTKGAKWGHERGFYKSPARLEEEQYIRDICNGVIDIGLMSDFRVHNIYIKLGGRSWKR